MLTEYLPVRCVGSYGVDNWEREFALCEVLAVAFTIGVLG